jgi:hypothetical protein
MPIAKERPMPRIVAGADLMAALRQSIEKAREQTPKEPAKGPAAAAAKAAAANGKRAAKGSGNQREMLLPIAGGAPAKEAGGEPRQIDRADYTGLCRLHRIELVVYWRSRASDCILRQL